MSKGFAVTLEGKYMVEGGHGRKSEKKDYKVVVNVPKYGDDTLSVIKNRLLGSAIRKFDSNYKTFLTHSITGVQPLGEQEELPNRLLTINNMNVNQLVSYVRGKKLPIALHLFTADILKFRQAITSYEADSKKFLQNQVKLQEDYDVQKELQELNPDLETEGKVTLDANAEEHCKPVSLPVISPEANVDPIDLNSEEEYIMTATEAAAASEVAPEQDEAYLTDGSESFNRASEAPFPDDIDDEIVSKDVSAEVDVDSILKANELKVNPVEDLIGDL